MAKDKDIDVDFNDEKLNFDDLDMDMGDLFGDGSEKKDDRKPIEVFEDKFKENFKKNYGSDEVQAAVKKVLPPKVTMASDEIGEYVHEGKRIMDESTAAISKSVGQLRSSIAKALPLYEKVLPKFLVESLKYQDEEQERYREKSEEEKHNEEVNEEIADINRVQLELQKQAEARKLLREQVDSKRFESQQDLLFAIRNGIERQSSYHEQIAARYQRRLLEVSMHQLYTQRNILANFTTFSAHQKAALETIVKNTALPDFVKMRSAEMIKEMGLRRLINFGNNKIGNYVNNFKENLINNVENKAKGFVSGITGLADTATMAVDASTSMAEMDSMFGGKGKKTKEQIAGEFLGSQASKRLNEVFLKKLFGRIDKGGKATASFEALSRFLKYAPEGLNRWAGESDGHFQFLKDLIPKSSDKDITHDKLGASKLTEQAEFDMATRRSIVDVIPALLSKIHLSTEGIRTGLLPKQQLDEGNLLEWDHDSGELSTRGKLDTDYQTRVDGASRVDTQVRYALELVDLLDSGKILDTEKRKQLAKIILGTLGNHKGITAKILREAIEKSNLPDVDKVLLDKMLMAAFKEGDRTAKFDPEYQFRLSTIQEKYRDLEATRGDIQESLAQHSMYTDAFAGRQKRLGYADMQKGRYQTQINNIYSEDAFDEELAKYDDKAVKEIKTTIKGSENYVPVSLYDFKSTPGWEPDPNDEGYGTVPAPRKGYKVDGVAKERLTYEEWVNYRNIYYEDDEARKTHGFMADTALNALNYLGRTKAGSAVKDIYRNAEERVSNALDNNKYYQGARSSVRDALDGVNNVVDTVGKSIEDAIHNTDYNNAFDSNGNLRFDLGMGDSFADRMYKQLNKEGLDDDAIAQWFKDHRRQDGISKETLRDELTRFTKDTFHSGKAKAEAFKETLLDTDVKEVTEKVKDKVKSAKEKGKDTTKRVVKQLNIDKVRDQIVSTLEEFNDHEDRIAFLEEILKDNSLRISKKARGELTKLLNNEYIPQSTAKVTEKAKVIRDKALDKADAVWQDVSESKLVKSGSEVANEILEQAKQSKAGTTVTNLWNNASQQLSSIQEDMQREGVSEVAKNIFNQANATTHHYANKALDKAHTYIEEVGNKQNAQEVIQQIQEKAKEQISKVAENEVVRKTSEGIVETAKALSGFIPDKDKITLAYANGTRKGDEQAYQREEAENANPFTEEQSGKYRDTGKPNDEDIIFDVYVKGEREPRLLASKLRRGEYFLDYDNSPIYSIKDITGPVKDSDGNIVISTEDFHKGLVDYRGNAVIDKNTTDSLLSRYGKVFNDRSGMELTKAIVKAVFKPMTLSMYATDIYLPDENGGPPTLVISKWGLLMGRYRNQDGKVIRSIKEIDGAVYDNNMDLVLSAEDLRRAVDKKGRPIAKSYLKRRLRLAGDMFKVYGKVLHATHVKPLKWFFGIGKNQKTKDEMEEQTEERNSRKGFFKGTKDFASKVFTRKLKAKSGEVDDALDDPSAKNYGGKVKTIDGIVVDKRTGKQRANNYKEEMKEADEARDAKDKRSEERIKAERETREKAKPKSNSILDFLKDRFPMLLSGLTAIGGLFTKGLDRLGSLLSTGLLNAGKMLIKGIGGVLNKAVMSSVKGIGAGAKWAGSKLKPMVEKNYRTVKAAGIHAGRKVTRAAGKRLAGAAVKSGIKGAAARTALRVGGSAAAKLGGKAALAFLGPIGAGIALAWTAWEIGSIIWDIWKSPNKVDNFRIAAYGADPENEKHADVMLQFERYIIDNTTVSKDGVVKLPKLDFEKSEMKKILGGFMGEQDGFEAFAELEDEEKAAYTEGFTNWYNKRFKKVFTQHVKALHVIDPKTNLKEAFGVTGDLPNGLVFPWLRKAYFKAESDNNPYTVEDVPFFSTEEEVRVIGQDEVYKYFQIVADAYRKDEINLRKRDAEMKKWSKDFNKDYKSKFEFEDKEEKPSVASGTVGGMAAIALGTQLKVTGGKGGLDKDTHTQIRAILAGSNFILDDAISTNGQIKEFDAIRMRLYGLNRLTEDKVVLLRRLEQELAQEVTFRDGKAELPNGAVIKLLLKYAQGFGWSLTREGALTEFKKWVDYRFLPVYLAYASLVYRKTNNKDFLTAASKLSALELYEVALELTNVKVNLENDNVSIWDISYGPTPNEKANQDRSTVSDGLRNLEKSKVSRELVEPSAKFAEPPVKSTTNASLATLFAATKVRNDDVQTDVIRTAVAGVSSMGNVVGQNKAGNAYSPDGGDVKKYNTKVTPDKQNLATAILSELDKTGWSDTEKNHFLAQITHETGGLQYLAELGGDKYFANKKYGAKWKGRGVIQLTWEDNYRKFAAAMNRPDILENPNIVATDPNLAVQAGIWWWNNKKRESAKFRKAVETDDVKAVSKAVNGGYNGLNDRINQYAEYKQGKGVIRKLAGDYTKATSTTDNQGERTGAATSDTMSNMGEVNFTKPTTETSTDSGYTASSVDNTTTGFTSSNDQSVMREAIDNGSYSPGVPLGVMGTHNTQYSSVGIYSPPTGTSATEEMVNNGSYNTASGTASNTASGVKEVLNMADPQLVKVGEANLKPIGDNVNLKGMDQNLMKLLYAAVGEYASKGGKLAGITSAFRTEAEQQRLRKQNPANAAKGRSRHQDGIAIDLNNLKVKDGKSGPVDQFFASGIPQKYGFVRNLMTRKDGTIWEPWHVENKFISKGLGGATTATPTQQEYTPEEGVPTVPEQTTENLKQAPEQQPQQQSTMPQPEAPVNTYRPSEGIPVPRGLRAIDGPVNNSFGEFVHRESGIKDAVSQVASNIGLGGVVPPETTPVDRSEGMQTYQRSRANQIDAQQRKLDEVSRNQTDTMIDLMSKQLVTQKGIEDKLGKLLDETIKQGNGKAVIEKSGQPHLAPPARATNSVPSTGGHTPAPMVSMSNGGYHSRRI